MVLLTYVGALLAAFIILVAVHEWGHFIVARKAGVIVVRFSIGFGPKLFSWKDKQGTEFVFACIPLGGYVKMLEGREGDIPEKYVEHSFDGVSPQKRIAISIAGPLANLVLAAVIYWLIHITGSLVNVPFVGAVTDDSLAAQAGMQGGEEILMIDGTSTASWSDVGLQLISRIGDTGAIDIRTDQGSYLVPIDQWLSTARDADPLNSLGLNRGYRPLIGEVYPDSPAEDAGLQAGDLILAIDGKLTPTWSEAVRLIQASPAEPIIVRVARADDEQILRLVPEPVQGEDGVLRGFANMRLDTEKRVKRLSLLAAIPRAVDETTSMITLSLGAMYKMIVGSMSVSNIAGPVSIAQFAGQSAQIGLEAYLRLLAMLSISLGIVNLLPIPLLDGGHILYSSIELVARRPISERAQSIGIRIGMFLVGSLIIYSIYNDTLRFIGS